MWKLFRDAQNTQYWFAYSTWTGWVKFPPRINGWNDRQPSLTPQAPAEVPLHLAFNTGLLEAIGAWQHKAA
jgi:hypothetical protein